MKVTNPIVVRTAHTEGILAAEIVHEGHPMLTDVPKWYIDAAWIEDKKQAKLRDLTEREIKALEDEDETFQGYALEAIHEFESNFDPTPLE